MEITSNSVIDFNLFLKITESEARALNALTVYGSKQFLEVFYKHLGKSYMGAHEEGLIKLFESIKANIPKHLNRIDKTRRTFKELNPNDAQ